MLGKFLLTVLVITVAFALIRQQSAASRGTSTATATAPPETPSSRSDLRAAAWLFLVLMLAIGGLLYFLRWQDDHRIVSVTLYRDASSAPVTYQVYRYQLESRSFVTTDGVRITLAQNERMEVSGLDQ